LGSEHIKYSSDSAEYTLIEISERLYQFMRNPLKEYGGFHKWRVDMNGERLRIRNIWNFYDGSYVEEMVNVVRTDTEVFKGCKSYEGGNSSQTWGSFRDF